MRMKLLCLYIFAILLLFSEKIVAQEVSADSLLAELNAEVDKPQLLPQKMLITQRGLWGQNGLYRKIGLIPELNAQNREKELRIRRTFLKIHQAAGLITLAGMIAQGIIGSQLYSNYSDDLKHTHTMMATGINIAYGTTAFMAFTAPPPLVNRAGSSSVKWHKGLAYLHLTGMIATNILSHYAAKDPEMRPYHRAAAYTTFGAFATSIVVFTLKF